MNLLNFVCFVSSSCFTFVHKSEFCPTSVKLNCFAMINSGRLILSPCVIMSHAGVSLSGYDGNPNNGRHHPDDAGPHPDTARRQHLPHPRWYHGRGGHAPHPHHPRLPSHGKSPGGPGVIKHNTAVGYMSSSFCKWWALCKTVVSVL